MVASVKKLARRGRPPLHAGQSKRASFNTRLTPALKDWLEKRASESGRSLSEEIEHRLDKSRTDEDFARVVRETVLKDVEDSFGGARNFNAMQLLAATSAHIERTTGKSWLEDAETRGHVRQAFNKMLDMLAPPLTGGLFELSVLHQSGRPDLGSEALLRILQQRTAYRKLAAALASEPLSGDSTEAEVGQGKAGTKSGEG
jgi:hypothetical protein